MKILLIGGTGKISMAVTKELTAQGNEICLLNRGSKACSLPDGVEVITADAYSADSMKQALNGRRFDAVCQFIAYDKEDVLRDIEMFRGNTSQYVFISSASVYNKPAGSYIINEGTAISNPYWKYSQKKIDCENVLMNEYRSSGFPVTIVRPSHTYDETAVPVGMYGKKGSYQIVRRMLAGKPVIIHGDGSSLWCLTHNSDFAAGFAGLIGNPHAVGEAFQITGDEALTWNQIYSCLAAQLKVELKSVHISSEFLEAVGAADGGLLGDKACSVVFDNSKLKRAVPGFVPKVRLEQGIRMALEHIAEHPKLQTVDKEFDSWCDMVIQKRAELIEEILRSSSTVKILS